MAQSKDFTPSVFVERDWWRTSNSSPWSRTVRLPSLQGAWHWWCSPRRRLERDQGSLRTPTSRWSTPRSVRQRPRNKRHKIRQIQHSPTAMEFVLVLWHPLLSYGYSYRVSVPDRVKPSFVIFDIRALWRSECPDAKNYKWRLHPVWHICSIAVPIWQQWASKG